MTFIVRGVDPLTQGSDYDFPMVRGRRPDDVHSEGGTPLPQGFLTFIVVRGGVLFSLAQTMNVGQNAMS